MTFDFWATVRVGSGVMACMAFPHDCNWKAILFHKDTAESSGTAGVFRFVLSRLTSQRGGPLTLVPELAKESGREGRLRRLM